MTDLPWDRVKDRIGRGRENTPRRILPTYEQSTYENASHGVKEYLFPGIMFPDILDRQA